jgi:hypothetical protein
MKAMERKTPANSPGPGRMRSKVKTIDHYRWDNSASNTLFYPMLHVDIGVGC